MTLENKKNKLLAIKKQFEKSNVIIKFGFNDWK